MVKYKLDKRAVKVSSLDENDEKDYWRSMSPRDRLKAVEINRRIIYGYTNTSSRFQGFFEVAQLQENQVLANRRLRGRRGRYKDLNDLENLR